MNHLIILSHPNSKSFCKGIMDTIEKSSTEKDVNTRIRNLYEIGFDPILKPSDFESFQNRSIPSDIKTEQEHIAWADLITVVYPV